MSEPLVEPLVERLRAMSTAEWVAWMDACLRGKNTLEGRRTTPDDPLLAVRRALRLGLGAAARLDHFAATLQSIRQRTDDRTPAGRARLRHLLAHLAATATAFEREQPGAAGIEDTILALGSRDDLGLLPLRALAALDRPESDAFWLRIAEDGPAPPLATEVLAGRRSDKTARALDHAVRFYGDRPDGEGWLRALLAGLLHLGVPQAALQGWVDQVATDDATLGNLLADAVPAGITTPAARCKRPARRVEW